MKFSKLTSPHLIGFTAIVALSSSLSAQIVNVGPTDITFASTSTTLTDPGTVLRGNSDQVEVRTRKADQIPNRNETVTTFANFDISSISSGTTISSATLSVTHDTRLNAVNASGPASVGAVTQAWDISGTNNPLFIYGFDFIDGNDGAINNAVLLADIQNTTPTVPGTTISVDLTSTVQGWVNGTLDNNGLAFFIDGVGSQGAGFNNVNLAIDITPPMDTDMDGMPDAYEIANSYPLNPLDINNAADAAVDNDADGGPDGLTNLQEFLAGTNPQDSDTDDDTLSDGDEGGALNPFPNPATNPLIADSDGDGINDGIELLSLTYIPVGATDPVAVVTDPNSNDTDGDSLLDAVEVANGLDPTDGTGDNGPSGDPDLDDLITSQELTLGTNPGVLDTDGDGLDDGEEVNGDENPYQTDVKGDAATTVPGLATDPLNPDSDGDGLTDFEEINNSNGSTTNPRSEDTDNDFLLDGFEANNGLDPLDPTGDNSDTGDLDGDSVDNFNEQMFGIDPNNVDSDGDGLRDGGNFSLGQFGELDTTNRFTPVQITDPNDPDTDGDYLSDFDEVTGGVTDGADPDSDDDGFLDGVEVAASTDPNDASATPTLATVTWTVAELTSELNLITNGPLVLASNMNGAAVTANGIPFDNGIDETNFFSVNNFQTRLIIGAAGDTFYDGEDPALVPLLTTQWNNTDDQTVSVFGLTIGLPYVIQVGRADDRNSGTIPGRYIVIDGVGGKTSTDPVGTTNSIFGGGANPAILFTGTFVATESVQSFELQQFTAIQDIAPDTGSSVLNFIQVRQTDDLSTGGTSTGIEVVSCGFNGTAFDIEFANLVNGANYELRRSATLDFNSPDAIINVTATGTTDTFSEDPAPAGKSFYQLSEAP